MADLEKKDRTDTPGNLPVRERKFSSHITHPAVARASASAAESARTLTCLPSVTPNPDRGSRTWEYDFPPIFTI